MTSEVSKCTVCLEKDATFDNFECGHKVLCDDCTRETFRQRTTESLRCNICRKESTVIRGPDSLIIGTTECVSVVYGFVKKPATSLSEDEKKLYFSLAPSTIKNVSLGLDQVYTLLGAEKAIQTIGKLENLRKVVESGKILNEKQATLLWAVWDYVAKTRKDFSDNGTFPSTWLA